MRKIALLLMLSPLMAFAQSSIDETIKLNQVGMYPEQEKVAVIENGAQGQSFYIQNSKGKTVYKGNVSRVGVSPWSGKKRAIADFSTLQTAGDYTFVTGQHSRKFTINPRALDKLAAGLLDSYYIMRSGVDIDEKYAGVYHRHGGHPDTQVYIHESAATKAKTAGTVISSPGGWYDAGDYNKYIVNSAFTIGQILTVYEQNKDYFAKLKLQIPENTNSTPDVLDEMMFNLKWMLTMQDTEDGGVYHKLTNANFDGTEMPDKCTTKRYVVEKTTAATLDFAAVMSLAARLYEGNKDYPNFSSKASAAAKRAWQWAVEHPSVYYDQDAMNQKFKPAITTGAYDDTNVTDEFFWAASELYFLTHDEQFLDAAHKYAPQTFNSPVWGNVAALATYDWAMNGETTDALKAASRKQIVGYADWKAQNVNTSCFQTPCGNDKADFAWASLAEQFATPGITFLYAYEITKDKKYITMAQENADYILGRNATGYCYITGFGQKSPMHPHHRLSTADGIDAPVPGLLVGGPNQFQQDKQYVKEGYPSNYPDESYIDSNSSYASNEIAINWNAGAVGLITWLDALEDK